MYVFYVRRQGKHLQPIQRATIFAQKIIFINFKYLCGLEKSIKKNIDINYWNLDPCPIVENIWGTLVTIVFYQGEIWKCFYTKNVAISFVAELSTGGVIVSVVCLIFWIQNDLCYTDKSHFWSIFFIMGIFCKFSKLYAFTLWKSNRKKSFFSISHFNFEKSTIFSF